MSPAKGPPSGRSPSGESLEKLRAAHDRSEVAAAAARAVTGASRGTRTHSDVKDGGTDLEQGCDGSGSCSGSDDEPDEPDDDPSLRSNLFFMPPHLRVVQIQENPMILGPDESIFENLTFGIKKSPATDWDELEARAVKISKVTYYGYLTPR